MKGQEHEDNADIALLFYIYTVRTGKPSQPLIESAVRQTSYLWSSLSAEKVIVPSDHAIFTSGTVVGIDKFESQGTGTTVNERTKSKGKVRTVFNLLVCNSNLSTSDYLLFVFASQVLPPWNLHSFLLER